MDKFLEIMDWIGIICGVIAFVKLFQLMLFANKKKSKRRF